MADNTKIEWADATVNAVNGCSLASPGCAHCYAMKLAGTRMKKHPSRAGLTMDTKAGPVWTGEVRLSETQLLQPLAWKRGRRIFWNAHGDLFHGNVPDEWIDRVFAVCALTPQHTHMILTKRPERMREYLSDAATAVRVAALLLEKTDREWGAVPGTVLLALGARGVEADPEFVRLPLPNVWLGTSVEDQVRADERIPHLLATPAAVRFLSCEPLLGPVDLLGEECDGPLANGHPLDVSSPFQQRHGGPRIDWVIVGGESGPGARPMHPDWARSLRDQCAAAGVPFHFKQWGEWAPVELIENSDGGVDLVPPQTGHDFKRWRRWEDDDCRQVEVLGDLACPGVLARPVGKRAAGRLLDGVEHNGMPA